MKTLFMHLSKRRHWVMIAVTMLAKLSLYLLYRLFRAAKSNQTHERMDLDFETARKQGYKDHSENPLP